MSGADPLGFFPGLAQFGSVRGELVRDAGVVHLDQIEIGHGHPGLGERRARDPQGSRPVFLGRAVAKREPTILIWRSARPGPAPELSRGRASVADRRRHE